MIPPSMDACLRRHVPDTLLRERTRRRDGRCHLVLGYRDEHLLSRMGIVPDKLGPKLVAFMWDEASAVEIGGYLVVDNLAMGAPSMGGIRVLPDITPADIHNLARGMTLKNAAASLPFGGGKSGIVADPAMDPSTRRDVVRGFARLLRRYRDMYIPGPDVGSNDADMKTIAVENGLEAAVSKPAEMGGNRIDELGAAAGGVVIALERLIDILPRLTVLPQFARLKVPGPDELTVLVQGFGAVGAHAARLLATHLPGATVVGVSDADGCLVDAGGLPVDELFALWRRQGGVTLAWYEDRMRPHGHRHSTRFSTDPDHLLRESAFALIPAAPVPHYLGVRPSGPGSVGVEWDGRLVGDRRRGQHLLARSQPQGRPYPHGAGRLPRARGDDRGRLPGQLGWRDLRGPGTAAAHPARAPDPRGATGPPRGRRRVAARPCGRFRPAGGTSTGGGYGLA